MNYEPQWYSLDPTATPFSPPIPYVAFLGGTRNSLCIDPTYKNASSCALANGVDWSYTNKVCYVTSDAGSCTAPRVNLICDQLAAAQCGNFTFTSTDNKTILLQCVYDRQKDCPDQASCETATNGACDDGFLEDPTMPPWVPAAPACIVPFTKGDSYGYPLMTDCENDAWQNGLALLDPTLGCIYWPQRLSINITINGTGVPFGNTTQSQNRTCMLAGGYWAMRATNQDTCENSNHSWACLVDGSYAVPIRAAYCSNDAVCDQQDYSWEGLRTWTTGSWTSAGSTMLTAWVLRSWDPINKWTATFDFNKLSALISTAVGNRIQQAFEAYSQCNLGLYGPVFEKLSVALLPFPPGIMNIINFTTTNPGSNSVTSIATTASAANILPSAGSFAHTTAAARASAFFSSTSAAFFAAPLTTSAVANSTSLNNGVVKQTQLSVATSAVDIQPAFDAIIIGAGMAGMSAARILVDSGYNVLVVESRNRTGGRLWSDMSLGFPVDLGASWIHHISGNPLTALAQQCGLSLTWTDDDSVLRFRSNGTAYTARQASASDQSHQALLGQCILAANNLSSDQSFAAVAKSVNPGLFLSDTEQWQVSSDTEFEYGAAAELLSMKSLGSESQFNGLNNDYMFPKGFDQIVSPTCMGANITVLKSTSITYIDYSNDTAILMTDSGVELYAKVVVVTVPLGVLKNNSISFNPPLPLAKQEAIEKVGMGTVNKVFLSWRNGSWIPAALSNLTYIGVDVPNATMHTRGLFNYFLNAKKVFGVVGFMTFAIGQSGADMEKWNDTLIVKKAIAQLQKAVHQLTSVTQGVNNNTTNGTVNSTTSGTTVPLPDSWVITRWNGDPNSFGAYSYAGINVSDEDFDTLATPVIGKSTIFFAGEHTSSSYRGTVHGAFLSGQRAAQEAVTTLFSLTINPGGLTDGNQSSRRLFSVPSSKTVPAPKKPLPDPKMKCPSGAVTIPQKTLKVGALNTAVKAGKKQAVAASKAGRSLPTKTVAGKAKPSVANVKDTATTGIAVSSAAEYHNPSLEPKKPASAVKVVKKKAVAPATTAKSSASGKKREGRHLLAVTTTKASVKAPGTTTSLKVKSSASVRHTTSVLATTPPPAAAINFTCVTCNYSASCMTGYAVVNNNQGVIVGQLIGAALSQTGMDFSSSGNVIFCFTPDPTITQCTNQGKFPVPDIAWTNSSVPKAQQVFTILQVNVTVGPQYCANLPANGPGISYWPIRRASNLYPVALLNVAITFGSVSDPSSFQNPVLQNALKQATAAGLGSGVKSTDVSITQVCKSDGSGCIVPSSSRRRLLATGVTASVTVSTPAAATLSSAASSTSFGSSFATAWDATPAAAIVTISPSSIKAAATGIQQPLAPLSPDSAQAQTQAATRAAVVASGGVYLGTTSAKRFTHTTTKTAMPTTQTIQAMAQLATSAPGYTSPKLSRATGLSPSTWIVLVILLQGILQACVYPG